MSTVQTTAPMLSSADAEREVAARYGVQEISDGAARTIAGWWAGPGAVGHVLASLSTGRPVDVSELLTDIHHTRKEATTEADRMALDVLATWALNKDRPLAQRAQELLTGE